MTIRRPSDGIPTDRPQSVHWCILHSRKARAGWNCQYWSDWPIQHIFCGIMWKKEWFQGTRLRKDLFSRLPF